MFAVIHTGGKQYRVAAADQIEIERLPGDEGDAIAFDRVLMVGGDAGVTVGAPTVEGATVAAEIVRHSRGKRLIAFKKRRRQNSRRTRGHRQDLTVVRITDILTDGAQPAKAASRPEPAAEAPLAEAPATPAATGGDDLTRISGVGPVLVGKLNDLGVTSFAQIAAWTEEDVARFDEELNFKGRIEREGWIGQAAKLAAGEEQE